MREEAPPECIVSLVVGGSQSITHRWSRLRMTIVLDAMSLSGTRCHTPTRNIHWRHCTVKAYPIISSLISSNQIVYSNANKPNGLQLFG